jgi:hypothetical protein
VFQGGNKFIGKAVTGAAIPIPQGITALDHKIRLNPVKKKTVIKGFTPGGVHFPFRQGDKITDREGCLFEFQTKDYVPPVGLNPGKKAVPEVSIPSAGSGLS